MRMSEKGTYNFNHQRKHKVKTKQTKNDILLLIIIIINKTTTVPQIRANDYMDNSEFVQLISAFVSDFLGCLLQRVDHMLTFPLLQGKNSIRCANGRSALRRHIT